MRKQTKTYLIQAGLFILTFITTTLAGKEWMGLGDWTWDNFLKGCLFSVPFLGILTVHEFGHYITSRLYKIKVTLPYYIPFYIPFLNTIGTFGAFIRIKSPLYTRKMVFDVGIAGPLAGFVIALGVLYYGFTHLPPREYVLNVHPEYVTYGNGLEYEKHVYSYSYTRMMDSLAHNQRVAYADSSGIELSGDERKWEPLREYATIVVGKNLLFTLFEEFVAEDKELIPNRFEMFHYPFLFAGYLALFFTALNLLPIGQLDGGHILYGLVGAKKHKYVSISFFILFVYLAGVGIFQNNILGNAFASTENLLAFGVFYLYFLYFLFGKLTEDWKTNLMIAVCVFTAQFFTEYWFPNFRGIGGFFLVFAVLIGRMLGVEHPPAVKDEPLSLGRKILGWLSFVIFILCFTPFPLTTEAIRP